MVEPAEPGAGISVCALAGCEVAIEQPVRGAGTVTGLYNRRGFLTLADQQLNVAARAGRSVPLLFVDFDGMKTINDTYGHHEETGPWWTSRRFSVPPCARPTWWHDWEVTSLHPHGRRWR